MDGLQRRRGVGGASGVRAVEWDGLREALWLARRDVGRAWISYPISGLFVFVFGLLVVPGIDDTFLRMEGFGDSARKIEDILNAFFADYLFLVVGPLLAVNSVSGDYLRVWSDVFSQRLLFLRSLPVPVRSLVAVRAASMLFALPFTVPAFFLPVFFLSGLRELGSSYVWFVGIWLGWSLLYAGVTLLCELTLGGRAYVWLSVAFIAGLMVIVLVLEWTVDLSLVARSATLALEHGPLAATASLLVGGATFALLARLAARLLVRRESL